MSKPTDRLRETGAQTAGPYVHIGCVPSRVGLPTVDLGQAPVSEGAKGLHITVSGRVLDADEAPVCDALLETWQPDAAGLFAGQAGADPAVSGFCRLATDPDIGAFALRTVKPGVVVLPDGRRQAPHILVWIVARGINAGLWTRIYFEGDETANDPVLSQIDPPERAHTLIARRTAPASYHLDIRLQGAGETVFLDM